jgi:tRNA (cmo5U34)-methyltransferase
LRNGVKDLPAKDQIFDSRLAEIGDFRFDDKVADAFDDMVQRSVPYYLEIQRMMAEMAADFAAPGTNLYDLGCSTGATFLAFDKYITPSVCFYGIDESPEMLGQCAENLRAAKLVREFRLLEQNLNHGVNLENASVVTLCLTLQFVRPLYRARLVKAIYDQLLPEGCLILVEKVLGEDSVFNRLFIKYYYDFKKRNGYSDISIAQKREALENVLVPYKLNENIDLLKQVGFKYIDTFFKWYNFTGVIAVK